MSGADRYFDRAAEVDGDEESDNSFDEETGEPKARPRKDKANGARRRPDDEDDSSEEESDDEEEIRKVREGFIVEDEDDEEGNDIEAPGSKKRRRKRRHSEQEDGFLDDDDLDLIGEGHQEKEEEHRLKRLKKKDELTRRDDAPRGLDRMFDDEDEDSEAEEAPADRSQYLHRRERVHDEFEDFIEEDEESDLGDEDDREDLAIAAPRRHVPKHLVGVPDGMDEKNVELLNDIFGGDDYDDILIAEREEQRNDAMDDEEFGQQPTKELKDLYEPSEMRAKMLTKEDDDIRGEDEPERFQVMRKQYNFNLTDADLEDEARWIADNVLQRKINSYPSDLKDDVMEPLDKAVKKVLEFISVDSLEVPFIFHHRKDYLIHTFRDPHTNDPRPQRLLDQEDLWFILDQDFKFRGIAEKRKNLQKQYASVDLINPDETVTTNLLAAKSLDDLQDLQDYMNFTYSAQLRDASLMKETNGTHGQHRGPQTKKSASNRSVFERIRASKVYSAARMYGLTPEQLVKNITTNQKREVPDDPEKLPDQIADEHLEYPEFGTSISVLKACQSILSEELFLNPSLRRLVRLEMMRGAMFNVFPTDKGVRTIDDLHPYAEFKYLRRQGLLVLIGKPAMYLQMLKAEQEGLIKLEVEFETFARIRKRWMELYISDNFSDAADAWNREREKILGAAIDRFKPFVANFLRTLIRDQSEDTLARDYRRAFLNRIDQAPWIPFEDEKMKPEDYTLPGVLALTNGMGEYNEPIVGIFMAEDGRVLEFVKYDNLREPTFKNQLVEFVNRRKPEVIVIGGFSVATKRLRDDLRLLITDEQLKCPAETGEPMPLRVVFTLDEVARLYMNSERGTREFPSYSQNLRYCVGLARYLQSPLQEYAALGKKDVASLRVHPDQQLLPQEKLEKQIETALVDIVNLVGVEINAAVSNEYIANLVPYIAGLGRRKSEVFLKAIAADGELKSRGDLVGGETRAPVCGGRVWMNCASFIKIVYMSQEAGMDYLDNTRVHPEDYDLGRKMAADALELDEEDVQHITSSSGIGGVVKELVERGEQEKVDDLILEEYAEELDRNFNQRKRATLETIREELQHPYEELRPMMKDPTVDQVFTMLTGETKESLHADMVVPVNIRRVNERYIACRLDSGIEGNVQSDSMSDDMGAFNVFTAFHTNQTVRAKVLNLNLETFWAELSLRESDIKQREQPKHEGLQLDEWDWEQEDTDRNRMSVVNQENTRTARVIKHPLFHPFTGKQAEEFLSNAPRGDAVIRPSSLGHDHIAITWKVDEGVYQHIDVIELDKETEFTVGRTLKVAGKYTYSDLDELMVMHVKAIARKVDEMMLHEKFKRGTRGETEKWLNAYSRANEKRSQYAFCIDGNRAGYFDLCFKPSATSGIKSWTVKAVPNAFELQKNLYPDMPSLCNGFKKLFTAMSGSGMGGRPGMMMGGRTPRR